MERDFLATEIAIIVLYPRICIPERMTISEKVSLCIASVCTERQPILQSLKMLMMSPEYKMVFETHESGEEQSYAVAV